MRAIIALTFTAALVAGCSSPSTDQATDQATDQTTEPQTVTPQVELQAWAGGVCSASNELRTTVGGIATSIDVDLTAGLEQLPQVYEQLQASVGEVDSGIDAVQAAVADVPASSPEAVAFAQELDALATSARTSGQEAVTAAQDAVNADNVLTAGLAAAGAVAAGRTAYEDTRRALTLIDETRSAGQGPVGEAFATAPECTAL